MYYKVVRISKNNRLISACMTGAARIEYRVNEEIFPTKFTGGIFVFKDLYDAKQFQNEQSIYMDGREMVIYSCKVKNPRKLYVRGSCETNGAMDFWRAYFLYRKNKKSVKNIGGYNCPTGTYLVSSLTLVEEIQ